MDVYIDNMVVKIKNESDHLNDLTGVFKILKQHNLWLNTAKCAFGVIFGNFLGYLVTRRGIETNPEQIMTINDLVRPKNAKLV